jgi:radical SAM superfamily enzyme YgiQ (UPF0313 family)
MLTEDKLKMLKSAGLHGVTFAVENASEELRSKLLNRHISNDTIKKNVDLLHKYDIKFRIENMLGIPNETIETAINTLKFNIDCKPDIAWASLFTPYPGTDLGNYCYKYYLVSGNNLNNGFFTNLPLALKDKYKIERLQKLFGLICAIPTLKFLAPVLIRLPFSYKFIYKKVKSYMYKWRLFRI